MVSPPFDTMTLPSPTPGEAQRVKSRLRARRITALALFTMALATCVSAITDARPSAFFLAGVLTVWATRIHMGPLAPERLHFIDALLYVTYIPLVPFYLNFGADAFWGEQWYALPPEMRWGLLSGAALITALFVLAAWLLHVREVRHFRASYLRGTIYARLRDHPDRSFTYEERAHIEQELCEAWGKVSLPLSRCELLIRAGIPPEAALRPETTTMTDEHLEAMAWMLSTSTLAPQGN